jgi:hypothetical protein
MITQEQKTQAKKKIIIMAIKYLVTTRLDTLKEAEIGCQIFMVDGTVPGWTPTVNDYLFDHHRKNGADIQIDELPKILANGRSFVNETNVDCGEGKRCDILFVATKFDADACVAAAWLQLKLPLCDLQVVNKLRAIAYECDHLGVPESLSKYAEFAAQCVAAIALESEECVRHMGLPEDKKDWTVDQKEAWNSALFETHTKAIIAACKGERKFPGELGEAAEYWEKIIEDTNLLLNQNRLSFYKETLLVDLRGLENIDCRCGYKAYEWLKRCRGHEECQIPICLTIMDRWDDGIKTGAKYTLGVIPLHPKVTDLDYTMGTFEALNKAESEIDPDTDHWGGRKTVGGSPWNNPSKLSPEQVIDIALSVYH